eukprot:CAMPEP_0198693590 /NCGR_PEP_ID=MMETSP1468-20131203/253284_1 /TAXON_ID=1461545 /ORGANISM="Mantoniella sp, Strain CCMP1436" /LENGTH=124 /DNA_ID=CAMNT_0044448327 /DNA_START=35 /DNA_END=406 /DNA_ORIENTATION=-
MNKRAVDSYGLIRLGLLRRLVVNFVAVILLPSVATQPSHPDPYETLHVSRDAAVPQIKLAFRNAADTAAAEEQKLVEVVEAYQEVLDAAYAQELLLTPREASGVHMVISDDAMRGHMVGGGGYG